MNRRAFSADGKSSCVATGPTRINEKRRCQFEARARKPSIKRILLRSLHERNGSDARRLVSDLGSAAADAACERIEHRTFVEEFGCQIGARGPHDGV